MAVRYYSSTAAETTLTGGINSSATTIVVGSVTGFPVSFPYTLALDYEGASEELVDVTAAAGTSLTVTRAADNTSATSHNAGARTRHVSSARDFRDSREHEEDDTGVHGVAGELVGTTDTQSLSNKTLVDATGTLNRIDILSEGVTAWQTTINGDIDHDVNLTVWKRGPSEAHGVTTIGNDGVVFVQNENAAADSVTGTYRFLATKDDGTTVIFSVQQGGTVTALTDSGISGFVVKPRTTTSAKAFNVRNSTDTNDVVVVFNSGRTTVTGQTAANVQLEVTGASGQSAAVSKFSAGATGTGDIMQWVNPAGTVVGAVNADGDLDISVTDWTTFTPTWTVNGSPAMNVNVGWYKKLGKIVHFEIYTTWSASGTGSTNIQGNLPTTPYRDGAGANTTRQVVLGQISATNIISPGIIQAQILAGGAGTAFAVNMYDNNGIQAQYIQSGTIITIQGWYREA